MKDLPSETPRQSTQLPARLVPVDYVLVLAVLVLADLVLLSGRIDSPAVATLFGGALVAFLPGYALISALFPRPLEGTTPQRWSGSRGVGGMTERAALSVGASLAVVPLFALVLDLTVGFGRTAVVVGLTALVLVGMTVAAVRRAGVPSGERFRLPVRYWAGRVTGAFGTGDGGTVRPASVLLGVLAVLAVSSLVAGVVAPNTGESYSSLALLTEGEDGAVAGDYPAELTVGEPSELLVDVENHEGDRTAYTVVVQLQRVGDDGEAVEERRELERFQRTVPPGEQWRHRHTVTASAPGDQQRLTYLLYRGEPPAQPTTRNAYRTVHVWVDVVEADGG